MKKMLRNIIILLGCAIIFVAVLALVLIIAPGVEFFDIKYIRASDSKYEKTIKIDDFESINDIVVNGKVIPVKIQFVQAENILITIQQHFVGFTRSNINSTDLIVSNEKGVLSISTNEFEKFGYGQNVGDDYGVTLKLPMYYSGNLNITSNKSDIYFSGTQGNLASLSITTKNAIAFNSELIVQNVAIKNNKNDIDINDKVIIAGNISLETIGSNVTIANKVGGNINFVTRTGKLAITGCAGDLNVKSEYGQIEGVNESLAVVEGNANVVSGSHVKIQSVFGNANIKTKSGKITIGQSGKVGVMGEMLLESGSGDINMSGTYNSEKLKVVTNSGDINIESVNKIEVYNKKGKTNITEVSNLYIENGSGNIFVNRVTGFVKIDSKGGDVTLSSQNGGTISNAIITTKRGDVTIYNPVGDKYEINSDRGEIVFHGNKGVVSNLIVSAKKSKVSGYNVSGSTDIKTNAKVNLTIAGINGPIKVDSKDGKVNVSIEPGIIAFYNLNSKKKNIAEAPGLNKKTHSYNNSSESNINSTLQVNTRWGVITVVQG